MDDCCTTIFSASGFGCVVCLHRFMADAININIIYVFLDYGVDHSTIIKKLIADYELPIIKEPDN
jgi:hypothetical protein